MSKVKNLSPNKFNPRRISAKTKDDLRRSIEEFGDLGGVVFNSRTKQLVSAHQRSSVLDQNAKITIEKKFDTPTAAGTIATGFIESNGERFSYREVDWDVKKQTEALLAANKIHGEWDQENLRVLFKEVPEIRIEMTGFDIPELEMMEIKLDPIVVTRAILDGPVDTQTDEQYSRQNKGSTEEADRERLPDLLNRTYPEKPGPEPVTDIDPKAAFEEVKENATPQGRQIVIIIKCETDEKKAELKDLIKEIVDNHGSKFF